MPPCMIAEWNYHIFQTIKEFTEAIFGALPAAKSIESSTPIIKDTEAKAAFLDKLGTMK